jgi:hypothetical protein
MYQQTNCEGPPYSRWRFRTQRSLRSFWSSTQSVHPAQDQPVGDSWPSEAKDDTVTLLEMERMASDRR